MPADVIQEAEIVRMNFRDSFRLRGMFNLNDPRWGRGDDKPQDGSRPDAERPPTPPGRGQGSGQPPDLDELWRDLNRKLGNLFGGRGGAGGNGKGPGRPGGGLRPDGKSAGLGLGLIAGIVFVIWLGSGFFIVQEGQQAVITRFGKYQSTVGAGFNWRLPYPIERHETVFVTQMRSVDVGRDLGHQEHGPARLGHADRRREHRRNQVRRAIPPQRCPCLAVREPQPG